MEIVEAFDSIRSHMTIVSEPIALTLVCKPNELGIIWGGVSYMVTPPHRTPISSKFEQ